jgi:hypothetical protein
MVHGTSSEFGTIILVPLFSEWYNIRKNISNKVINKSEDTVLRATVARGSFVQNRRHEISGKTL